MPEFRDQVFFDIIIRANEMSHVAHINESCYTHQGISSGMSISRASHMNEVFFDFQCNNAYQCVAGVYLRIQENVLLCGCGCRCV